MAAVRGLRPSMGLWSHSPKYHTNAFICLCRLKAFSGIRLLAHPGKCITKAHAKHEPNLKLKNIQEGRLTCRKQCFLETCHKLLFPPFFLIRKGKHSTISYISFYMCIYECIYLYASSKHHRNIICTSFKHQPNHIQT